MKYVEIWPESCLVTCYCVRLMVCLLYTGVNHVVDSPMLFFFNFLIKESTQFKAPDRLHPYKTCYTLIWTFTPWHDLFPLTWPVIPWHDLLYPEMTFYPLTWPVTPDMTYYTLTWPVTSWDYLWYPDMTCYSLTWLVTPDMTCNTLTWPVTSWHDLLLPNMTCYPLTWLIYRPVSSPPHAEHDTSSCNICANKRASTINKWIH